MWFNVLQGAYPSLQQINKTLPVATDTATAIVRGTVMKIDASGAAPVFTACIDADATDVTAYPYFCLVPQDDFVAGMAGTLGQGSALSGTFTDPSYPSGTNVAGVAKVTGLAVGMPMEFETDQYATAEYTVGQLLTVADGGVLAAHTSGDNCVAIVTKALATKWVNSAWAVTGRRSGANVSILTAQTMWVPALATA